MSSNTIEGKLIAKLEIEEGISASGNAWQKRNFILETEGKYPKKICFEAFGERVVQLDSIKVGSKVSVTFDCESREYNNKYYTTLKAWKIE